MSRLPSDFPQLPQSVGGQALPDFMNAVIIERDVKLPGRSLPDRFDFSIKKSNLFGSEAGTAFDEGATWFPLKLVHFTSTSKGISSFRGLYGKGATSLYGKSGDAGDHKLALEKDEYITGISGTFTDVLTSLDVRTTKTNHRIGVSSGTPFEFNVPEDHHVVGFYGRADDHIRAFGVSYSRRLASLTGAKARDSNDPNIAPIYSNLYLDAGTRQKWANNDMSSINQKRSQAQTDLKPIYDNIKNNGEKAWTLVESKGEQYYLSWTSNATMWAYVKDNQYTKTAKGDKVKTSIVSLGSYSTTSNLLGLSGYVWTNVPIDIIASAIALTFTVLMRSLINDGVAWGIEFAATQLAEAAAAAGVEELALLVPASVASVGGLVIAGVIGIALFLAVMWLSDILFRKYFLTVNVFNFDAKNVWKSITWYADNAEISNDEWKTAQVAAFAPAGSGVTPPGFNPVTNLDSVVTYLAIAFTNDSTFLQGLGVGIVVGRNDNTQGLALKYVVHRLSDNEMGLQGINGDPNSFDLKSYYNGGSWVKSHTTQTSIGNLAVTGYTPYLSGAPDNAYEFMVNIGLPPSNF